MKSQLKKNENISPVENVKLFQACETNDLNNLFFLIGPGGRAAP